MNEPVVDSRRLVLFTAEYCPKCELAKKYLTEMGIEFDVSQDADEAAKYGVSVVPCLVCAGGIKLTLKDIIDYYKEMTGPGNGYVPM